MISSYPDDNPKTILGVAKPSLANIPPVGLFLVGAAMRDGAAKYGRFNWREHKITSSTYFDAMMRHVWAAWDGEELARDSGVEHLAHAAACLLIWLDAAAQGMLNDDRGPKGNLSDWLEANTKKITPVVAKPLERKARSGRKAGAPRGGSSSR